jgi:RHS repeat-associated protein
VERNCQSECWPSVCEPSCRSAEQALQPQRGDGPEIGRSFYRARYYDPAAGRFANEDFVGFDSGPNFYSYVSNSPADLVDPSGNTPCLDINKFVQALNHNALPPYGHGLCGRYLGSALQAGGINVGSHDGKDYGPYLASNGFSQVAPNNYQPQPGDIIVIQPYPGGSPQGHVQGFNGNNYVSDFIQPWPANAPGGIYPGPGYRKFHPPYTIYRPIPCPNGGAPNSVAPSSPAEPNFFQRFLNWVSSF